MDVPAPKPHEDIALIARVDPDDGRVALIRKRHDRVEAGVAEPLREGRAITGDVVRLKPRPRQPWLCDVETVLARQDAPEVDETPMGTAHAGPAIVASDAYRTGWERIWGERLDGDADVN